MPFDSVITLVILAVSFFLLATNLIRGDIVGILVMLAFSVSGVLTVNEALAGFANPAVIIIATMFIISETILYTGIGQQIGEYIMKWSGTSEKRMLVLLMVSAGLVGAFMSSAATIAIFLPIAMVMAKKAHLNHSRLLLPLAIASVISGMMTLVATTPNIVINNMLKEQGLAPLSFFSFTPYGIAILLLIVGFMAHLGQNLLGSKSQPTETEAEQSINDLMDSYGIEQRRHILRVLPQSGLVGKGVAHLDIRKKYHVKLLALQRVHGGRREIVPVRAETVFLAGDILIAFGLPENIENFIKNMNLFDIPLTGDGRIQKNVFQVIGAAEVMLTPTSTLAGKSLSESQFQTMFDCMVLGIRREGETYNTQIIDMPLKFGDVLLVLGAWKDILRLRQHRRQYMLLSLPEDYQELIPAKKRAPLSLLILAVMVVCMVLNLVSTVIAVLGAAVALFITGCVSRDAVYRVISWQTVVLIAGILPLPLALQKTGILDNITGQLIALLGASPSLVVLSALFWATVLGGLFMSNTPMAVLITPVALNIAQAMGISPQACAMTIAIACSSAFISPYGSPVTMIVREPGGYSFMDYIRVGTPLVILSYLVTMALTFFFYL